MADNININPELVDVVNALNEGIKEASANAGVFNDILKKQNKNVLDIGVAFEHIVRTSKDLPKNILTSRDLFTRMLKDSKLYNQVKEKTIKLGKDLINDYYEKESSKLQNVLDMLHEKYERMEKNYKGEEGYFKKAKKYAKEILETEEKIKELSEEKEKLNKQLPKDIERQLEINKKNHEITKKLRTSIGNITSFVEKLGSYIRNPATAVDSLLVSLGKLPNHILQSAQSAETLGEAFKNAIKPITNKIVTPFKVLNTFMHLGMKSGEGFQKKLSKLPEGFKKLTSNVKNFGKQLKASFKEDSTKKASKGFLDLSVASDVLKKSVGLLGVGLGALTGILAGGLVLGLGLVTAAVVVVWKSFKQLYEFVDKKVMPAQAAFNKQLGATNQGTQQLRKNMINTGVQFELLGYSFEEGASKVREFAVGLKTVKMDKGVLKTGLELQAILGLTGEQAGKLSMQFMKAEGDVKGLNQMMRVGAAEAKAWGVPVNVVLKDMADAPNILARFGVANRKEFSVSTAKAQSYGLSIKEVTAAFGKQMDTFDKTAETSAKLNAIFGTNINSMKLMMETDPTKRMEMLRRELVKQGKEWDNLNTFEKNVITSQMGVDEQTAALMLSSDKERKKLKARKLEREKDIKINEHWNRGLNSIKSTVLALEPLINMLMRSFGRFAGKLLFNIDVGKDVTKITGLIEKTIRSLSAALNLATNELGAQGLTGVLGNVPELLQNFKGGLGDVKTVAEDVRKVIAALGNAIEWIKDPWDAETAEDFIEDLKEGIVSPERLKEIQKTLDEDADVREIFKRMAKREGATSATKMYEKIDPTVRLRNELQSAAAQNMADAEKQRIALEEKREKDEKELKRLKKEGKSKKELIDMEKTFKSQQEKMASSIAKLEKMAEEFSSRAIEVGKGAFDAAVTDALITKRGDIIKFDPNDNIFATKMPLPEMMPKQDAAMSINQEIASEIKALRTALTAPQQTPVAPTTVMEPKIEILSFEIDGREIARAQVKIAASGVG